MIRHLISSLMFCLVIGGAFTAAGQSRADQVEAMKRYQRGMKHFKAANYALAIKEYEGALEFHRHKNIHYFLGESLRRMGKLRKAYAAYVAYSDLETPAKREAFAKKLELLRVEKPSTLSLRTRPGGAQLSVDGKIVTTTPLDGKALEVPLRGGSRELALRLAGHKTRTMTLKAEFGEPLNIELTMVALAATTPSHASPASAPAAKGSALRIVAITSAVVAGVGLATGLGLNIYYLSSDAPPGYVEPLSITGYVVGGVSALVAGITGWMAWASKEEEPKASLTAFPIRGGAGIGLGGRF